MMEMSNKIRVWCKTTKHFTDAPFLSGDGHHLLWLHTGNEISLTRTDDEDYIIHRYTELEDINGNLIYQGDIVEYRSYEDWGDKEGSVITGEIRWSTFHLGWSIFPIGYRYNGVGVESAGSPICHFRNSIVVVGNVCK